MDLKKSISMRGHYRGEVTKLHNDKDNFISLDLVELNVVYNKTEHYKANLFKLNASSIN